MSHSLIVSVVVKRSEESVSTTCLLDLPSDTPLATVLVPISAYLRALESSWPKEPTLGEPSVEKANPYVSGEATFSHKFGVGTITDNCVVCGLPRWECSQVQEPPQLKRCKKCGAIEGTWHNDFCPYLGQST